MTKNKFNFEYGLIGNPLEQSYSPTLHKIFGQYDYQLCPLESSELDAFFEASQFNATNVTIPYKEAVIPYLDDIDPLAKTIQAVNTIVNMDGKLMGYNTDILGMKALLEKNQISLLNKNILILGTGGTAKTAKTLCQELKSRNIYLVSRKKTDDTITYQQAQQIDDIEIIINTTPLGMYGETLDQTPISLESFKKLEAVVDVIYNPLKTRFILEAESKGIKTCNGLYMLIMQAYYASQLFLYHEIIADQISLKLADQVYQQLLSEKANIVLIGMPSSGKTTIAKLLANITKRPLIDTDMLIEEREHLHPAEIIRQKGEAYFRQIEQEIISDIAYHSGQIIATGGGSILATKNQAALKANSKIYFLDRPLDELIPSASRPLSSTFSALEKTYQARYPIYKKLADEIIVIDKSASEIASKIKEVHYNDN